MFDHPFNLLGVSSFIFYVNFTAKWRKKQYSPVLGASFAAFSLFGELWPLDYLPITQTTLAQPLLETNNLYNRKA